MMKLKQCAVISSLHKDICFELWKIPLPTVGFITVVLDSILRDRLGSVGSEHLGGDLA